MSTSAAVLVVTPEPFELLLELLALLCSVVALLVSPVLVELLLGLLEPLCSVMVLHVPPALLGLLLELLELLLELLKLLLGSSSVSLSFRRALRFPFSGGTFCAVGRTALCSGRALVWAWV